MTTTFETAKPGDRVWSIRNGWGEIHDADESGAYPISVYYSVYWDEVEIEAPQKPLSDLELELLELKKDKARLDWLADVHNKLGWHNLRDAIDEEINKN